MGKIKYKNYSIFINPKTLLTKKKFFSLSERSHLVTETSDEKIIMISDEVEIYSKKIYGEPDKKLIEKAKMVLEKDYKDREICSHNAKEVKELFEQILKEIDLKWKINVKIFLR